MSLWQWIGGYGALAMGCFCALVWSIPNPSNGAQARPSLRDRLVMVAAALMLMALVGHDFLQRRQTAQIVSDAVAADRDPPSEATLQQEEIEGPSIVAAYFRQGYAWAEAHSVRKASECPEANRAYRDGCRAFVARR